MKAHFFALATLFLIAAPLAVLAQSPESQGFVSLTNAPFLEDAGNAEKLPQFLNDLYRILIGAAAVIAVLQIMRAGILWTTAGDSHEKIGTAKGLIRDSLLGLLLVLSPVIVFGIINRDILSLKIGGIEELGTENTATEESTLETQNAPTCQAFSSVTIVSKGPSCSEFGEGWTSAPSTCCSAADDSFQCCGKPK